MARYLHPDQPPWLRKGGRLLLAFFWFFGLFCGILFFMAAGDSFFPLMRSVSSSTVSIVDLLCMTALPFLLSIFLISLSGPVVILPICFCKAFLFSFVSLGILQTFGSAGWLLRCFLLFADCTVIPFLYWFWLRHLVDNRPFYSAEAILTLSFVFLIGSVDYRIISPFVACLIEF